MIGMIGAAYHLSYILSFDGFSKLMRTFSYDIFNNPSVESFIDVSELYRTQFRKYLTLTMISLLIAGIAAYVSI